MRRSSYDGATASSRLQRPQQKNAAPRPSSDGATAASRPQRLQHKAAAPRPRLKFLGYLRQGYWLSPQHGSQKGALHVLKLFEHTAGGKNSLHHEREPGDLG